MTVQLLFGTSVAFGFIAWAVVATLYIWTSSGPQRVTGFEGLPSKMTHVWSGRAVQEVSSILAMRSCINVSGL